MSTLAGEISRRERSTPSTLACLCSSQHWRLHHLWGQVCKGWERITCTKFLRWQCGKFASLRLIVMTTKVIILLISTTFPGCWETATWVVMNKPVYLSKYIEYTIIIVIIIKSSSLPSPIADKSLICSTSWDRATSKWRKHPLATIWDQGGVDFVLICIKIFSANEVEKDH